MSIFPLSVIGIDKVIIDKEQRCVSVDWNMYSPVLLSNIPMKYCDDLWIEIDDNYINLLYGDVVIRQYFLNSGAIRCFFEERGFQHISVIDEADMDNFIKYVKEKACHQP